jgi:hypothetical protein
VVAGIGQGDGVWEQQVPPAIVEVIKRDGLFGYKTSAKQQPGAKSVVKA